MKVFVLVLILLQACAIRRPVSSTEKKENLIKQSSYLKEGELRKFVIKEISRKGKFSTVTDQDITTERYKRKDGETILTLEKGELRTEVEKMKSGRLLTRTWQDGSVTSMTIAGSKRTTMILLDKSGDFVQKIVTEKGSREPVCFEYAGGKPAPMEDSTCLELISGFD